MKNVHRNRLEVLSLGRGVIRKRIVNGAKVVNVVRCPGDETKWQSKIIER